jgi:hypothetical protein
MNDQITLGSRKNRPYVCSEDKKSYYHLQSSADGQFNSSSTIAWIPSNTTPEEREAMADAYTYGQFTAFPGFYQIIGPIQTPSILSLKYLD